jgi:hypothetical protein
MNINFIYVTELRYDFFGWLYLNKHSKQWRVFVLGILIWWVMFAERESHLTG